MDPAKHKSRSSAEHPLLILLVGANPLPNYLAVCALRPAAVALVHTQETRDAKDRLKRNLRKALEAIRFVEPDPFVEDATCASTVRRRIDRLLPAPGSGAGTTKVWLNYTGGTKVMAAHARMAFHERSDDPSLASYLDEGAPGQQPRLRFDDGTSWGLSALDEIPLSLETILDLHGFEHEPRTPKAPAPSPADVHEILSKVLADVSLAKTLYSERQRLEKKKNPRNAIADGFRAEEHGLSLSLPEFPTEELLCSLQNGRERDSWFRQWYGFIGGEWLEDWVAEQVRALGLVAEADVSVGVKPSRGREKEGFELDVAAVRGQRSYFISCTTDDRKKLCKGKLFEVAVRSRQLGGDLARAALVCLAPEGVVGKLREDVEDVWGASNTTRVFGLSDVREWSDCGKEPNRSSLRDWLES